MLRGSALRRVTLLSLLVTAGLVAGGVAGVTGVASAQGVGQQVRAADLATMRAIDVPAAWRTAKGRGVTVAVLDTGASQGAPDLAGSVSAGPDYTAGANPPGYQPPHLHGTYISSIIAGHGSGPGRAEGMVGVAPQAKILSVRVILDDQEPGFLIYNENAQYDGAIAQGIRYAVRHGADVINMSLGGPAAARSVRQALTYAIDRGVVVVAAAGNGGTGGHGFTPYSYPAAFTGVISVAAVGARGQHVSFSDRNASVVVSAPGVNVVGAGPAGSWISGSGTSPASAFVAGVAALIRSRYPQLAPALVAQAIVSSAQRRPAGGYSPGVGFGEVDASAALAAAGKLAATRSAVSHGMSASAHFAGGASGPVAVAHHDRTRIAVLAVVAAVAAIGFLAAIVMLAVVIPRRRRRRPSPPPSQPAPPSASLPASLQAAPHASWPEYQTAPAEQRRDNDGGQITDTAEDPDDIS
jgi:type VII secretion-associated serine protease mycosin